MSKFDTVVKGYANMWDGVSLKHAAVDTVIITEIKDLQSVFEAASRACGAPWWWVAAVLYREANLDTTCYLGNGQSLKRKTTVVPIGRGPFASFEDGCVDALTIQKTDGIALRDRLPSEWTIEFALFAAEELNGEGYQGHNENSPYVWAGTNFEQPGLFTSDHGYDHSVSDKRLGVAAIVKGLEMAGLVTLSRQGNIPMPKTTATPVPSIPPDATTNAVVISVPNGPNIIIDLEKGAEEVLNILPTVAFFVPQLNVVTPFIPIMKKTLQAAEQSQAEWGQQDFVQHIIQNAESISADMMAQLKKG